MILQGFIWKALERHPDTSEHAIVVKLHYSCYVMLLLSYMI